MEFFHGILEFKQDSWSLQWTFLALNISPTWAFSPCIHIDDFFSVNYAQYLNSPIIPTAVSFLCFYQFGFLWHNLLIPLQKFRNATVGCIPTNLPSNFFITIILFAQQYNFTLLSNWPSVNSLISVRFTSNSTNINYIKLWQMFTKTRKQQLNPTVIWLSHC